MPDQRGCKVVTTAAIIALAAVVAYLLFFGRSMADLRAELRVYEDQFDRMEQVRDSLQSVVDSRADSVEVLTERISDSDSIIARLHDEIEAIQRQPDSVPFDGTAVALADSISRAYRRTTN